MVRLDYRVHPETRRVLVKLVDLATGEVMKEIPPERVLDTLGRIHAFVGQLLDRRV